MRKRQRRDRAIIALAFIIGLASVACFSIPVEYAVPRAVLDPHKGTVAEIVGLLEQGRGSEAKELLDSLHGAVTEARAMLVGAHFTGSADVLTDPFTLPAGTYRVHLRTDGAPFVSAIPVAAPDDDVSIFMLITNDAVNGISKLYVSGGERIMLEFSYVDAPYELWFEEVK